MVPQFMDLVFKKHDLIPLLESVPEHQRRSFGPSSKYSITLRFKGKDGWDTNTYGFHFDTGAFISYAPDSILEVLGISVEFESFVRGIAPGDACKIKVKFARASFKIVDDDAKESREVTAWFASHAFKSPLLLGMKEVIDAAPRKIKPATA
jgi:hypothetical protein